MVQLLVVSPRSLTRIGRRPLRPSSEVQLPQWHPDHISWNAPGPLAELIEAVETVKSLPPSVSTQVVPIQWLFST